MAQSLPLQLTGGRAIHHPEIVLKADGAPYTVFTPFSRAWKSLSLPSADAVLPAPRQIPTPPEWSSQPIPVEPALPPSVEFAPGEVEAQRRLAAFVDGDDPPIHRYARARDRIDLAGTSGLSPYLRLGMLSTRQAVVAAAAPYFRVFNPVLQGQKFDPDGTYARRWVPELAGVPDKFIHQPWAMPPALQRQVGCIIGQRYPTPIVDHAHARERTIAAYAHARTKS